jgi:tRNA modification GTPase
MLDTAGIRNSHDSVEQEGVRRAIAAIASADLVLMVLDGSQPLTDEDKRVLAAIGNKDAIHVINKVDLPQQIAFSCDAVLQTAVSCRTGEGLNRLRRAIADIAKKGAADSREHAWAINRRHESALKMARESLSKALGAIDARLSHEFAAMDLRGALDHLGLIIGATYTEDILERIFNDFCIGK